MRPAPRDWEKQVLRQTRPVTHINWFEACAYALWLTDRFQQARIISREHLIRLPTEAEWERAARGTEGRTYPWGEEEFDDLMKYFGGLGVPRVRPVGIFPEGSVDDGGGGVLDDLSSNVWEWCLSRDCAYPYEPERDGRNNILGEMARAVRSGHYMLGPDEARCAHRERDEPAKGYSDLGFRLVVSLAGSTY